MSVIEHKILTSREVAEWLRVHPSTIYRMLRRREIPAFRMGSDWRFDLDQIAVWFRERGEVLNQIPNKEVSPINGHNDLNPGRTETRKRKGRKSNHSSDGRTAEAQSAETASVGDRADRGRGRVEWPKPGACPACHEMDSGVASAPQRANEEVLANAEAGVEKQ